MTDAKINIPQPRNESVRPYAPGDTGRDSLNGRLDSLASDVVDIPIIVGGQEVRTGITADCISPHDHGHTSNTRRTAACSSASILRPHVALISTHFRTYSQR